MTRPPNPIAQGFRAAGQSLPIFLLEILWRWFFAIIAVLAVLQIGTLILTQLQIRDVIQSAWRGQNYQLMGMVAATLLFRPLAQLARVALELVALAFVLGLIWGLLAAVARRITVPRFASRSMPLRFGAMLVVHWLRALVTIFAGLLMLASLVVAVHFATRGPHIDLANFYLIVSPCAFVLAVLWLFLNWHLSQAAIFGRAGQGFPAALSESRRNIGRHPSDFAGIAFVFLLLRLVLALIALAIIGLTSSMMATALPSYIKLCLAVVLAYCIVADFLYIARTAAYLALAAQPDPLAAEMGIIDPELPVEKSSLP